MSETDKAASLTGDALTPESGETSGCGGDYPRGWWVGKGTTGRGYVRQGRRGYQGYWWYVALDGWHRGMEWCEHVHKTHELAAACGARQAARRNVRLRRTRGEPVV